MVVPASDALSAGASGLGVASAESLRNYRASHARLRRSPGRRAQRDG